MVVPFSGCTFWIGQLIGNLLNANFCIFCNKFWFLFISLSRLYNLGHFYRKDNCLIQSLLSRRYRNQDHEDGSVSITLCLASQFQHPEKQILVETNKFSGYLHTQPDILLILILDYLSNHQMIIIWPPCGWAFSYVC